MLESRWGSCCDLLGRVHFTNSCVIGRDNDISRLIPYLFPHLFWAQRTLARQSALCARSTSSSASFMPFITISHIFSFLFFARFFVWLVVFLFMNRNKMSQKTEMKSESREFGSFPKGALEQRYSLIQRGDFALCTNARSGPVWAPLCTLFSWAWQVSYTLLLLSPGLARGLRGSSNMAEVTVTPG